MCLEMLPRCVFISLSLAFPLNSGSDQYSLPLAQTFALKPIVPGTLYEQSPHDFSAKHIWLLHLAKCAAFNICFSLKENMFILLNVLSWMWTTSQLTDKLVICSRTTNTAWLFEKPLISNTSYSVKD